MTKFDYKKWVTENRHGKINEQTAPITHKKFSGKKIRGITPKPQKKVKEQFTTGAGSIVTCYACSGSQYDNPTEYQVQSMANSNIQSYDPNTGECSWNGPVEGFINPWNGEEESYIVNDNQIQNGNTDPSIGWAECGGATDTPGGATASTSSDVWLGTGDPDNPVQDDFDFQTDCSSFNELPQGFQEIICSSCQDPTYINAQCECCSETGGMPGSQGMPMKPMKKKFPMKPMKKKFPMKNLAEIKNTIKRTLKNLKRKNNEKFNL